MPEDIEYNELLCDICQSNEAHELHTCPYQVEINDNHTFLCNCCSLCESECSQDI